MSDLISKSKLKDELLKIPSEMGLIKKAWVMQTVSKQKTQDSNNNCNCQHNSNSRENEPCYKCDSQHTNADRIRNMSDEELAEFMSENTSYYYCGVQCKDRPKSPTESSCNFRWLDWLQSEVKAEESEEK